MSRSRAMVKRTAQAIATAVVFSGAFTSAIVLHANTPAVRRVVQGTVSEALGGLFQGKIVVKQLDELVLGREAHVKAEIEVLAPDGTPAIVAKGVTVHLDTEPLVTSLLHGRTPDVRMTTARVDELELVLDVDADKKPKLARTFEPKKRHAPEPKRASVDTPESVRLAIPTLSIGRVHAHGNVATPPVDASLEDLRADMKIRDNVLHVDPVSAQAIVRSPKAPSQTGPLTGTLTGKVKVPLAGGEPEMTWELAGDASGVPFTAKVLLAGSRVDATVDVPKTEPETLAKAFPVAPITKPVDLHAHVEGDLGKQLSLDARAHAGEGEIVTKGTLGLKDKMPFVVDADLVRIDASALTGPISDVTAHVHAEGTVVDGMPAGSFRVDSKEGAVAGQKTPTVDAEGTFDARAVHAKLHAKENGLEVRSTVDADLPAQRVSFDVTASAGDLSAIARAPGIARGAATARATGTVDLASGSISGRVVAHAERVEKAPASIGHARIEASISGPVASPLVDVTATAEDVKLTSQGKTPLVYPTAKAHARVSILPTPRIVDAEVTVDSTEPGASLVASAAEIRLANGNAVVRGARVSGLGSPLEVEAHTTASGGVSLRAHADGIDLHRARALTGIKELEMLPEGSRASLDIDMKSSGGGADGHVDLAITAKDGSAAEVHAELAGKHVSGRARVATPGLGWVEVSRAELDLPGPPSAKTFERATGSVDLRGEIDLAKGAAMFGGERIREASGMLTLAARIERADPTTLPTVFATAQTRGLEVLVESDSEFPTRYAGIDGAIHVLYDAATDDTEVGLVTWDKKGALATADFKSRVPLVAVARGEKKLDRATFADLPLSGIVDIAPRKLSDVPRVGPLADMNMGSAKASRVATSPSDVRLDDLRGTVGARVLANGTVAHPLVDVVVVADELRRKIPSTGTTAQAPPQLAPVSGEVRAHWNGRDIVATVQLDEADHARATDIHDAASQMTPSATASDSKKPPKKPGHVRAFVLGRLDADDVVLGRDIDWNASAEVDVEDLELGALPLPMGLRGALTTRVSLRDVTGDPKLNARAHVAGLGVSGARIQAGDFEADAKNGAVTARLHLSQEDGGSAHLDVKSTALEWKGVDVKIDKKKSTHVEYAIDRMRLSVLRPIVRRSIPEIDGLVMGKGSATVDETSQVFEGGLVVSGGHMYVNALGEDVTDIGARASFERSGGFRIEEASGRIGAGRVTAAVAGRMKGLGLAAADAVVVIPPKRAIPLTSEGAVFADAAGEVRIAVRMNDEQKQLTVDVLVPQARIDVPDRGKQNLQKLDPDETIAIGIRRPDGTLVPALLRPPSTRVVTDAGDKVAARLSVTLGDEVTLEGRGLRLSLKGRTLVEVAREIAVTGQIQLKSGGSINVQGRRFVVDHGTVTFGGTDPSNPTVIAAAYWDASDKTRVWVEFQGPLKTAKPTLRSEPPYSKNEIFSILVFGRPDPNLAGGGDTSTLSGGVVAAQLNQALGELDEDIDLEQDRTSGNRVRTKVGYHLRRNLKVQLGYASGISQREPDTTYLFVEWQFIPKWSLIGTRGDKGTSILDMLFQHRY